MEVALAARASARDFEATVGPLYPNLVRRLTLIVGSPDDARDLAQTTYLRAFEAWGRFDGSDPRAWLYSIGIRLAIDELRRRRRLLFTRLVDGTEPSWALAVDTDLWRALDQLDRRQRAALVLNVLDGYTQAEIATLLGVPAGTVASWLARSKSRLRELLGKEH